MSYVPKESKDYRNYHQELQAKIEIEEQAYGKRLTDCKQSSRLNNWETSFIENLVASFKQNIYTREVDLTEKQIAVLKKIEKKVHAAG